MREIKFRIWDKKYRTFEYNSSPDLFISTEGEVYEKDSVNYGMQTYTEYNQTDSYQISQYTGLKDKNGNEIFEGDIVQFTVNSFGSKGIEKNVSKGVVYYNEDMTLSVDGWMLCRIKSKEVIGNIYENPELLEEGK